MASAENTSPRTVVIGGGVAGLVAAYQASKSPGAVRLVEAAEHLGGVVHPLPLRPQSQGTDEVAELTVDAGAEAFAIRTSAVADLVTELGMADEIVSPNPTGSWLYLPTVGAVPAPKLGLLGIPGNLQATEVLEALGSQGLAEALERSERSIETYRQALAEGTPVSIGALVEDLLGPTVLDRLVAPVIAGVHSADAYHTEVRAVAPGLLERLVETGSLSGAVKQLRQKSAAGALVASLRGGMHTLVGKLEQQLRQAGVEIKLNTAAQRINWENKSVELADGTSWEFDRLVIATDGPQASGLLATIGETGGPGFDPEQQLEYGSGVGLVTMVIDHPHLDSLPRGTGLLVAPSVKNVAAKAMTHASAKWGWLTHRCQRQQHHRHVVRLSYGRVSDPADGSAPGYNSSEAELIELAQRDAAVLLGLDEKELRDAVADARVVKLRSGIPSASIAHRERTQALVDWTKDLDAPVALTGAAFAGTGLAAVVKHATESIEAGNEPEKEKGEIS